MIVLKKPIITEKSMKLTDGGLYTFMVDKEANKQQIAKAVSDQFKVDVVSVKTVNTKGEIKFQRKVRKAYKTSGFKKALVQLKAGDKIAIFENAPEDDVTVTTGEGEPTPIESGPIVMKEKKDILRRTKVRIEKGAVGAMPTTQRKVITGK